MSLPMVTMALIGRLDNNQNLWGGKDYLIETLLEVDGSLVPDS